MNDGPSTQPPHFQEQRFLYFAVLISLVGHILLFGISHLLSQSSLKNTKHHKAIDIDLVQTNLTPEPAKPKKKQESPKNASKTASKSKPNTAPAKKTTKKKNRSTQKALSGNPVVKRKRRVITPEELVQNALKQIQQHEATKPQPKDRLSDRLKKMRQEIKNSEARETQTGSDAVTAKGKKSAGQISILERYHQSVRVIIRSNWAFPPRPSLKNPLRAEVGFTILTDGSIREPWMAVRSGNANFDRSALSAVLKSSPLPPFPAGIKKRMMPIVIIFNETDLQL